MAELQLRTAYWRTALARSRVRPLAILALLTLFSSATREAVGATDTPRKLFVPDGATFVTFYDLPSRRFRSIRDAFIVRNFELASADLLVTESYLSIEATRADEALQPGFVTVIERLGQIRTQLEAPEVSAKEFDTVFARAHWLLAQHFLGLALIERDQGTFKTAGWYLIACAHHMERTVLWSNARVDKKLEASLEKLRSLANRLGNAPTNKWVKENRPIVSAAQTLRELGRHLDRKVVDTPGSRLSNG